MKDQTFDALVAERGFDVLEVATNAEHKAKPYHSFRIREACVSDMYHASLAAAKTGGLFPLELIGKTVDCPFEVVLRSPSRALWPIAKWKKAALQAALRDADLESAALEADDFLSDEDALAAAAEARPDEAEFELKRPFEHKGASVVSVALRAPTIAAHKKIAALAKGDPNAALNDPTLPVKAMMVMIEECSDLNRLQVAALSEVDAKVCEAWLTPFFAQPQI